MAAGKEVHSAAELFFYPPSPPPVWASDRCKHNPIFLSSHPKCAYLEALALERAAAEKAAAIEQAVEEEAVAIEHAVAEEAVAIEKAVLDVAGLDDD